MVQKCEEVSVCSESVFKVMFSGIFAFVLKGQNKREKMLKVGENTQRRVKA